MKYISVKTLAETLTLTTKQKRQATLIAGGTNVIPDMRAKALKPDALIDISHLKGLSYIKEDKKKICIGGLTTISELASSKGFGLRKVVNPRTVIYGTSTGILSIRRE